MHNTDCEDYECCLEECKEEYSEWECSWFHCDGGLGSSSGLANFKRVTRRGLSTTDSTNTSASSANQNQQLEEQQHKKEYPARLSLVVIVMASVQMVMQIALSESYSI